MSILIDYIPNGRISHPVNLADGDTLDIGIPGAVIVTRSFYDNAHPKAAAFDALPIELQQYARRIEQEKRLANLRALEDC